MAREICGKTKVTVNGKEYICKDFPEVWKVFKDNKYSINEENKQFLIRLLFINGYHEVDENLKLEIVWDEEE